MFKKTTGKLIMKEEKYSKKKSFKRPPFSRRKNCVREKKSQDAQNITNYNVSN